MATLTEQSEGHDWKEQLLQGDEIKKGKGNYGIRGKGSVDTHLQFVRNVGKKRESQYV